MHDTIDMNTATAADAAAQTTLDQTHTLFRAVLPSRRALQNELVRLGCCINRLIKFNRDELQHTLTLLHNLKNNAPVAYVECRENYLTHDLAHPALYATSLREEELYLRYVIFAEAAKLGNMKLMRWIMNLDKADANAQRKRPGLDVKIKAIAKNVFQSGNM